MEKRGKVLRDPYAGPGLLMVEGQQYSFVLEGVWQSPEPPKPGLVVDVEVDAAGQIHAVRVVPEPQLAREQAQAAIAMARQRGSILASGILSRFGGKLLVAGSLLIVGWFFLSAISIQTPLGRLSFTFWDVVGFLNAKNIFEALVRQGEGNSASLYGFLGIVAIAGPFIPYFWKERWALLGGFLPLLFMILVALLMRGNLQSAWNLNGSVEGVVRPTGGEAMKSISLGIGFYLSVLVTLYFAGIVIRQFLVARAQEAEGYEKSQKAAA